MEIVPARILQITIDTTLFAACEFLARSFTLIAVSIGIALLGSAVAIRTRTVLSGRLDVVPPIGAAAFTARCFSCLIVFCLSAVGAKFRHYFESAGKTLEQNTVT